MAALITGFAGGNSTFHLLQNAIFGRKVAGTEIREAPVFIIGHWRSGTTYLHELMTLDQRFAVPTTYECFAPNHFLLTEWFVSRYLGIFVPKQRPTDNVSAGWDRPQEDEFALCNLGAPSPYLRMAFPANPPICSEYLDMEGISPADLERWKQKLLWFVRMITYYRSKRVVLKSPPHTGRVGVLLDLFPDARFIHMVRDPYVLFPSTIRLWQSLDRVQGLQWVTDTEQREYVFESLVQMYGAFERQRPRIDPSQICDLRYEELVKDPVAQLRKVYEHLDLGGFDSIEGKLETHVRGAAPYVPNRHELDDPTRAEITRRWAGYIEKYGY